MIFSVEFWIQIVLYGVSIGVIYGTINTRMKYMEEKLNKHNHLVERMVVVEQSTKSAHHRLDDITERER